MVKVAVVGSGNLGTEIALAIHRHERHSVVVLSRKPRPDLTQRGLSVTLIDYSKPETLVSALHGVHTLISVIFSFDPSSMVSTHLALLQAAKEAGVTRFAPSEFAYSEAANREIGIYHPKAEVWKAVKQSGLQYTAFRVGMYLNLLAVGSPKPDVDEKVFTASPKFTMGIDISKAKADIPGTGEEKFNITTTDDIAGFVTASLDTEWTEESGMAGSVVTFHELVRIAERITGEQLNENPLEVSVSHHIGV